jgi:hypothetical protein
VGLVELLHTNRQRIGPHHQRTVLATTTHKHRELEPADHS